MGVKVNFIFGQLNTEEIDALRSGREVLSKMILSPDDFILFDYREGDPIQVETDRGERLWCLISGLEKVETDEGVLLIFQLIKK